MKIRPALMEDAPEIARLHAPYVTDTPITFAYRVPTAEDFAVLIRITKRKYPFLVAEENGRILGYTYVSAYKECAAYDWSVETSIYVSQDELHRGIGRCLYEVLETYLQKQHICNLYACITYPNPDSVAFHQKMGYREVAHFHHAGFKLGQWHDIIWMEKQLCPYAAPPEPFIPFPAVSQ